MSFARRVFCFFAVFTMLAGCSHGGRVTATTRVSPAEHSGKIPQPALRLVLRALGEKGVESAPQATVFVLSHWLLDEGPEPDQQRRFEGAPFVFEGAAVFLAVGPRLKGRKSLPPPPEDVIVKTKDKDSLGTTIALAGQDWDIGFSMKGGDQKVADRLTEMLREWLEAYRAEWTTVPVGSQS